jgi:hypothetical protein
MNTTLTKAVQYITEMEVASQDMFNALQALLYDNDIKPLLIDTKKDLFEKAEDAITAYLRAQGFN